MRKIRVLVVDDSTVVRRLLCDALASDPAIEVAGIAANGKIALEKIAQLAPDAVTLDIEMPVMDGLATLRELRKTHPKLPVVMFSTLTERGAIDTLNALALGASDYATKPANVGSVTAGIAVIKEQLVPKIKALCPPIPTAAVAPIVRRQPSPRVAAPSFSKPKLLAIGVSTGGPNALAHLFAKMPEHFPLPIVVVQHMPPVFTHYLAERLTAGSPLTVRESHGGEMLEPGVAYLAPGDFHITIENSPRGWMTRLNQGPMENSCRPAVDVLFRSVAETVGPGALAVVLTGMGYDGLRGSEAIHRAGGRVLAQDEATSVVWGMPRAVVDAGLADQILPLDGIAEHLVKLAEISQPALAYSRG